MKARQTSVSIRRADNMSMVSAEGLGTMRQQNGHMQRAKSLEKRPNIVVSGQHRA
jgi:hypothetical protein